MLRWQSLNGKIHLTHESMAICGFIYETEFTAVCSACKNYLADCLHQGRLEGWLESPRQPLERQLSPEAVVNASVAMQTFQQLLGIQFTTERLEEWVAVLKTKSIKQPT